MSVQRAVKLLGGAKVLGGPVRSRLDFVPLLRQGLPWASFEEARLALGLSLEEASESLRLPKRTLARRRASAKRLDLQESERLLRMATIGAKAEEVFGDLEKAHRWLRSPSRVLGGQTPLSLLDTDVGAQAVEDELIRIEYGVFA